jgi:hypothetical protein
VRKGERGETAAIGTFQEVFVFWQVLEEVVKVPVVFASHQGAQRFGNTGHLPQATRVTARAACPSWLAHRHLGLAFRPLIP